MYINEKLNGDNSWLTNVIWEFKAQTDFSLITSVF